jgi:hypothetical protein
MGGRVATDRRRPTMTPFRATDFARIPWARDPLRTIGVGAVALGGIARVSADTGTFVAWLALVAIAVGCGTLVRARRTRGETPVRGELVVDDDAVRFGGKELVRRRHLRGGFIVPDGGGNVRIELVRALGPMIELRASGTDDARELLRVLGFDASQRTTTFALVSQLATQSRWALAAVVALFYVAFFALPRAHIAPAGILAVVALSTLFIGASLATRTKMTIGADGVYAAGIFRRRFVAYTNVAGVGTYRERPFGKALVGIALTMRDGSEQRFLVGRLDFAGDRATRIAERIREALDGARRAEPTAAMAMLQRGGRDVGDWLGALRAIGAGSNVDLRTAPVAPETLWRIVEDPRAPQPARASAAVALGPHLDDESRERLRVTAAATAAPKLRVALDAAVGGDDEAIADALDELEREAAPR